MKLRSSLMAIFVAILLIVGFVPVRNVNASSSRANDFYFREMNAEYTLHRDENGDTTLDVVEELTAVFSHERTNRGIERAIPRYFEGVEIFGGELVALRNGEAEPVSSRNDNNGNVVFRIGDKNKYLEPGEYKYTLKYQLKNVFKQGSGRLIINVNGTGWLQRFENISVKLNVSNEDMKYFEDTHGCYVGTYGESNPCDYFLMLDNGVFEFSSRNVAAGQTLTLYADFSADRFPQPAIALQVEKEKQRDIVGWLLSGFSVFLAGLAGIFMRKNAKKYETNRAVVPQYLPPKIDEISFSQARVAGGYFGGSSAEILWLAVNGNLRICDNPDKKWHSNKVILEKVSSEGLSGEMLAYFEALFSKSDRIVSPRKDIDRGRVSKSATFYHQSAQKWGEVEQSGDALVFIRILSLASLLAGLGFAGYFGSPLEVIAIVAGAIGLIISCSKVKNLEANKAKNYLEGLKMYISLAEQDRLAFNQSFENAERFEGEFGGSYAKLYEKLLPWAALFGLEKTWAGVLEDELMRSGDDVSWVGVQNGMAISSLHRMVGDLSSDVARSDYGVSSSSVSGGSGGFSGGGAGGGGGGGW